MARKKRSRGSKPQPEQNVMYMVAGDATQYIDLASSLTAINRKQYHQTKNLKPLLYHWRAQCVTLGGDSDPIFFETAANTWTTKNAVTMLGAQYRKQLRSNGIRRSQLPRYGRELRLSLSTNAGYTHASGGEGFTGSANLDSSGANSVLIPENVAGTDVFVSYTNTDGSAVTFYTSNELTLISIPETTADGEPEAVALSLLGTSDHGENHFAAVPEYLSARRNRHDHDEIDANIPSDDNLMMRIGAAADEHFDDVVDAIEDTGDTRPYDEAGANLPVPQGALMAAGDYCSGVAPLGLIKVTGNADSKYFITVTAITEM